jgi:hypothetical protein
MTNMSTTGGLDNNRESNWHHPELPPLALAERQNSIEFLERLSALALVQCLEGLMGLS